MPFQHFAVSIVNFVTELTRIRLSFLAEYIAVAY